MDNEKLLNWFIERGIDEEYARYLVACVNIYERHYKPPSPAGGPFKFRRPYDGIYTTERVEFL